MLGLQDLRGMKIRLCSVQFELPPPASDWAQRQSSFTHPPRPTEISGEQENHVYTGGSDEYLKVSLYWQEYRDFHSRRHGLNGRRVQIYTPVCIATSATRVRPFFRARAVRTTAHYDEDACDDRPANLEESAPHRSRRIWSDRTDSMDTLSLSSVQQGYAETRPLFTEKMHHAVLGFFLTRSKGCR